MCNVINKMQRMAYPRVPRNIVSGHPLLAKAERSSSSEFTLTCARAAFPEYSIGARRLVDGWVRQVCSACEVRGAWQRSRFASERHDI